MSAKTDFTYRGEYASVRIVINHFEEMSATIELKGLNVVLESIKATDSHVKGLKRVFHDREVMKTVWDHNVKVDSVVEGYVRTHAFRWRATNDPYNGFVGFYKGTDRFVCFAMLDFTDDAGVAELTCLVSQKLWGKGIGSLVCRALAVDYAAATIKAGYTLHGMPLTRIIAAVDPNHEPATRIMQKLGMRYAFDGKKAGRTYWFFALDLNVKSPVGQGGSSCVIL